MTEAEPTINGYTIKPLGPDTWEAFAQLAERHNDVWGGCFFVDKNYRRKGVAAVTLQATEVVGRVC
jgi:hypothetical protein